MNDCITKHFCVDLLCCICMLYTLKANRNRYGSKEKPFYNDGGKYNMLLFLYKTW